MGGSHRGAVATFMSVGRRATRGWVRQQTRGRILRHERGARTGTWKQVGWERL
jgi:hypothetical protein